MSERRLSLRVNQKFQARFLLEIVILIFILINLLLTMVLYIGVNEILTKYPYYLALTLGLLEGTALGLLYWYLLKTSHRIAGPLHALRARLHDVGRGNLTVNLVFRQQDHFHEVSEALNACVTEMRARIANLQQISEQLSQQAPQGSEMEQQIKQLRQELNRFKTS